MSETPANPFTIFLGPGVNPDDPRSLLGLPPSVGVSKETVLAALRARVDVISRHPQADSLHADEVRLLLHAAAARLIEPALAAEPASEPLFESDLARILARHGGWNRQAARELAMVARDRGVAPDRLASAVSQLTHARQVKPTEEPAVEMSSREPTVPTRIEDHNRAVRTIIITIPAIVLALVLGALALIAILQPAQSPAPQTPSPSSQAAAPVNQPPREMFPAPRRTEVQPPRVVDPASTGRVGDVVDLLRELSAATGSLDTDPDAALDRADKAILSLAREWTSAGTDHVVAASSGVIEFIYRASADPARALRVLDTLESLAAPLTRDGTLAPDEVAPATFSAGLLARLLRERDLPAPVRDRIRSLFASVFGQHAAPGDASYRSGALTALASMPPRLLLPATPYEDSDARRAAAGWNAWLAALTLLDGEDGQMRERLILNALEDLLAQAPEPTVNRPVYDAITLLVPALRWRKGTQARQALLRWFASPNVSPADLHAVTSALATRSAAEGIDISMVFSPAGGDSHRTELRDRYAAVWGLSVGPSRSELIEQWLVHAREALESHSGSADPIAHLAETVNLARLNQAASHLWAGNIEIVPPLLTADPFTIPPARDDFGAAPPLGSTDHALTTTTWAARYLAAGQAIPPRREILSQVNAPPTPLEADILAEEAVRGAPVQVRQDARNLVLRFASEATVINALLELAPTMPATRDTTELIRSVTGADIPDTRSPAWRVEVRKALVEKLIETLADQGPLAAIDRAAEDLAASYGARPAPPPTDGPDVSRPPPPSLEISARAYRTRLRLEAQSILPTGREPVGLKEIDTRYAARLRLASGRVHLFAAEVFSAAELLAYIASAERPAAAPDLAPLVRAFDNERKSSRHVFTQLRAAERTMLQLWMHRFGEPPA